MTDTPPAESAAAESAADESAAEKIDRLETALRISAANIAALNDHRALLVKALEGAGTLIEHLLINLRANGIAPAPPTVVAKARFDQVMRALLSGGRGDGQAS